MKKSVLYASIAILMIPLLLWFIYKFPKFSGAGVLGGTTVGLLLRKSKELHAVGK